MFPYNQLLPAAGAKITPKLQMTAKLWLICVWLQHRAIPDAGKITPFQGLVMMWGLISSVGEP